MTNKTILGQGARWWDDDFDEQMILVDADDVIKLWPDDPRVNYDPMGGMTGGQACANCFWFDADDARCRIVSGDIVATGKSDLWLESKAEYPNTPQEPIPVTVVNADGTPMDMGGMDMASGKEAKSKGQQAAERFDKAAAQQRAKEAKVAVSMPRKGGKSRLFNIAELLEAAGNVMRLKDKAADQAPLLAGFKAFDNGTWAAWWTNNFEDKVDQLFSEKAIDQYIARVERGSVPYPDLYYWHVPLVHGKAEWLGRVGHLVLAAGHFSNDELGGRFKEYYQGLKEPLAVSHGYLYPKPLLIDGVYHAFNTFEISPLPAGKEANSITGFEVKELVDMPITAEKQKALETILGADLAGRYLKGGEVMSKEAEALGLKFKEFDTPGTDGTDDVARAGVKALAGQQADFASVVTGGIKELVDLVKPLAAAVKELQDGDKAAVVKVSALESSFKAVDEALRTLLELQPRASKAAETVMEAENPYIKMLDKKEKAAANGKGEKGVADAGTGKVNVLGTILSMAQKQAGAPQPPTDQG